MVRQGDGNLVDYTPGNKAVWASGSRAVNAPQKPPTPQQPPSNPNNPPQQPPPVQPPKDEERKYVHVGNADYFDFEVGNTVVYGLVHDLDNLNTAVSKLWLHARHGADRNKSILP